MKYDMAGGGAVLGVMKAVSAMQLPVHIIGILPATENLPGGSATKPGDVVKSLNGKDYRDNKYRCRGPSDHRGRTGLR